MPVESHHPSSAPTTDESSAASAERCPLDVLTTPPPPADAPAACFLLAPLFGEHCAGAPGPSDADAVRSLLSADEFEASHAGWSGPTASYVAFHHLSHSAEAARHFSELSGRDAPPIAQLYGLCGLLHFDGALARARLAAARQAPDGVVMTFATDLGEPRRLSDLLAPLSPADLVLERARWRFNEIESFGQTIARAAEINDAPLERALRIRRLARAVEVVEAARRELALPAADAARVDRVRWTAELWFSIARERLAVECDHDGALREYQALLQSAWLDPSDPAAAGLADLVSDATTNAALLAEHAEDWRLAARLYDALGEAEEPPIRGTARFRAALMRFRFDRRAGVIALEAFATATRDPIPEAHARWYIALGYHAEGGLGPRDDALRALVRAHDRASPEQRRELVELVTIARSVLEGRPMTEPLPDPSALADRAVAPDCASN